MNEKEHFKEVIQSNIDQYGYHISIVGSAILPRFAYTIGLKEKFNFELVFAGGVYYLKEDLLEIFSSIVKELERSEGTVIKKVIIDSLGTFSIIEVNPSWSKLMLLGAFDYYNTNEIRAFQIIPDSTHYTLDIPNMSKEYNVSSEPVWQWLVRKWNYSAAENSTVVTNIDAMLGEPVTELMRWEENEWEMFAGAGPDIDKKDMRVVSLGTIFGIDKTLLPALNVDIGKGLWREDIDSEWNNWGSK